MFTREDSRRQDEELERLQNEFSQLKKEAKFLRKSAGLPEEGPIEVNSKDLTPETVAALEEIKAEAKRVGDLRATQFRHDTQPVQTSKAPGSGRRGVLRI